MKIMQKLKIKKSWFNYGLALGISSSFIAISGQNGIHEADPNAIQRLAFQNASPEQTAQLKTLLNNHWVIQPSSEAKISIEEGRPCARKSISELSENNDLVIKIPENVTQEQIADFHQKVEDLLYSPATLCAHRIYLEAQKLSVNRRSDLPSSDAPDSAIENSIKESIKENL
jgi:hypothetical protein